MDSKSLHTDVEDFNQQVILFVCQLDCAHKKHFGISDRVAQLFDQTQQRGCRSAFQCGVPLVNLNTAVIRTLKPSSKQRNATNPQKPNDTLAFLNFATLSLIQKAFWYEPTIAKFWFDLEDEAIDILEDTSLQQLLTLSQSTTHLLRLREGSSVLYWQRLLIGESVHDSNASFISHNTALLALGKWQMSGKHALAR
jgi:hypothetical protein